MKILNLFREKEASLNSLSEPYIIAEAGVNHEGSLDIAKRLIWEAKEGGAHAVKFQTYKASGIAIKNSPAYWDLNSEPTLSQHALFSKYDKFWKKEFEILKRECEKSEIEFMSTPFDIEAALFLNDLVDVFKISSSDITNKPFIEYIAEFRKPIILSTGASFLHEIQEAVHWIESLGVDVALLHCVLNYPTDDDDANLGMITGLRTAFPDRLIGYSDHTLPNNLKVLELAHLLGSSIIEKHFTHDKRLKGNDHYHAADMHDLKQFRALVKKNIDLFGSSKVTLLDSETVSRQNARRSLVASVDITKGEIFTSDHITAKRPGTGVPPKYIEQFLGETASSDIPADSFLNWQHIKI